jgi:heme/copper-type cytochrome/quinol oxidase subunit 4
MKKQTLKTLKWIFTVLGIIIIGAGIYLILRNLGVF